MTRISSVLFLAFLLILVLRLVGTNQPQVVSGSKVKITATLREQPHYSSQTQRFSLAGFQVTTWRYPEYRYGDRLEVTGIVKKQALDFPEDLKKVDQKPSAFSYLLEFREQLEAVYKKSLPEPQASLLSGIVLGTKQDMPKNFYDALQKTGTLHMVVASGMNVAIVSGTLVSSLVWFIKRIKALLLALIGTWFYVLLSGAEVPVLRAGIMASAALLAQLLGREDDGWRSLVIAAGVLLLADPQAIFDLGFQLSFTATFGIMYFGPIISKYIKGVPRGFKNEIGQTLGAQFATFPIILLNFGSFSLLSPVTNLLIVSLLPLIMKFGVVLALVGIIWLPAARIASLIIWPVLTYFVKVVEWFGGV